jgi:hypothetical protein
LIGVEDLRLSTPFTQSSRDGGPGLRSAIPLL